MSAHNEPAKRYEIDETSDTSARNPLQALRMALRQIRKNAEGRDPREPRDPLTLNFVAVAERALTELAKNILKQTRPEVQRVLIVEDNTDVGPLTKQVLEIEGLETRLVINGKEALEAMEAFKPDAVLLDIGLPGMMNGFEVAEALRQGGFAGRIVAYTAFSAQKHKEMGNRAGINAYVIKPAENDEALIAAIRGI